MAGITNGATLVPQSRLGQISLGLLGTALGVITLKNVAFQVLESIHMRNLRRKRKSFQEKRAKALNTAKERVAESEVKRERKQYIASLSTAALLKELQDGTITPTEALITFQEQALRVHDDTNCLVLPIEEAEARVYEVGKITENKGLLHGLPISIKDDYQIKGHTYAMGVSNLLDYIAEEDCVISQLLKKQGAVPFMKGNVPQFTFSYETSNLICGRTTHPMDKRRTPGGSSGGDAALVMGGGAHIAMGSDIGGSLRCPSAYCGLATLKPTSRRVSLRGLDSNEVTGQQLVWLSAGPMARDVDSVVLVMKALLVPEMYQLDPSLPIMPFDNKVYEDTKPLKVGMFMYDGRFPAVPACVRAVKEAKAALEKRGHTVIEWMPPDPGRAFDLYCKAITADEGKMVAEALFGEEIDECLADYFRLGVGKGWKASLRVFISKLMDRQHGILRNKFIILDHIADWWQLTAQFEAFRAEFASSFKEAGLDAVICPPVAFPSPVVSKESFLQSIFACNYLLLYNVLDIPAGVVPVSHVTQEDINDMNSYQADTASPWVTGKVKKDMETAHGLPLAVQCASLKWREEVCLKVMKEIELGLKE